MYIGAGLFLIILSGSSVALAQTDAERFAEGRIALDRYKDCRAAKDALESVSDAGRSEALWMLYAAKAYECLNDLDKALALYVRYNQAVGDKAETIEKIGDLRYRIAAKQRAQATEQARVQKAIDDKRDANGRLDAVLQTLRDQLNGAWRVKPDDRSTMDVATSVLAPLSCEFKVSYSWQERTVFEDSSDASRSAISMKRWIERVTLDLTKVNGMYLDRLLPESPETLHLYAEKYDHLVDGTWEMKWEMTGQEGWTKRGSILVPDFSVGWGWPGENNYTLRFDQSRSKESRASLLGAFQAAVATCKTAKR